MKFLVLMLFIIVGCSHQHSHQSGRQVASTPFLRSFFLSLEQRSTLSISAMDEMTRSYLMKESKDEVLGFSVPNWKRAGFTSEEEFKSVKSFADDVDSPAMKRVGEFVEREAHLIYGLEKKVCYEALTAVRGKTGNYFNAFATEGSTSSILANRPNPQMASGLGKSTDFYVQRLPSVSMQKDMLEQTRYYAKLGKQNADPALIANARRSTEAHARATEMSGVQTFTKSCPVQEGRYIASKADVDVNFARRVESESIKDPDALGSAYRKSMQEELNLTETEALRASCNLANSPCNGIPKQLARACAK